MQPGGVIIHLPAHAESDGVVSGADVRADEDAGGSRRRRGSRLLALLGASCLVMMVVAAGLLLWGVQQWQRLVMEQHAAEAAGSDSDTKSAALPAHDGAAGRSGHDTSDEAPVLMAPPQTRSANRGVIEVVDIGRASAVLAKALPAQRSIAMAEGRQLLVMTNAGHCGPCRAIDRALDDSEMQVALARVRLVRVDLHVFHEELDELGIRTSVYPAFFLIGAHGRPVDGIHGGEWDADIAENMAPVLGAFAKGRYLERRHEWSPTTESLAL